MMDQKRIVLTILWLIEALISIRILFFSLPVLINQLTNKNFYFYDVRDFFMVVISCAALLYLVVGVGSLLGHKAWRALHYLSTGLIFILSVGLTKILLLTQTPMGYGYYLPLILSVAVSLFVVSYRQPQPQ